MFGDDMAFQRALKELDPADWETFSSRFGEWDPARQQELLDFLVRETPVTGVYAARSGCEVSAALCLQRREGRGWTWHRSVKKTRVGSE